MCIRRNISSDIQIPLACNFPGLVKYLLPDDSRQSSKYYILLTLARSIRIFIFWVQKVKVNAQKIHFTIPRIIEGLSASEGIKHIHNDKIHEKTDKSCH